MSDFTLTKLLDSLENLSATPNLSYGFKHPFLDFSQSKLRRSSRVKSRHLVYFM